MQRQLLDQDCELRSITSQKADNHDKNENKAPLVEFEERVPWTSWLTQPSFYYYGLIYLSVRIMIIIQSTLIIFYLQTVLGIYRGVDILEHGLPLEFAILPMIMYLSSCYISARLNHLYRRFGR